MESVFESMPQATLQLVYIMRIGFNNENKNENSDSDEYNGIVFFLSISQSIISMTNSILKEDNIRGMQGQKWKKYKKRLPPTKKFFKHFLSRLSQVISRIFVLSLFWTVVGGMGFGILMIFELFFALCVFLFQLQRDFSSVGTILLSLNAIILVPPELMFADEGSVNGEVMLNLWIPCSICCCGDDPSTGLVEMCLIVPCYFIVNYVFCLGASLILSHICYCKCKDIHSYTTSHARLGLTFFQLCIVIIFGIMQLMNNDKNYLFNPNHGLIFFIFCVISFLIDCCFVSLFPNFSLPNGVNARSKWGLAFAGELEELKKLRVVTPSQLRKSENESSDMYKSAFWDERAKYELSTGENPLTCAMYALANKHYDVVSWLESQGATEHKKCNGDFKIARNTIAPKFDGWMD